MAPANDHDPLMDPLLRRVVSNAQAPDSDCVDAETLAAWVERTLPRPAAARVEEHVSSCARCQAVMAVFVRSAPEPSPAPAESLWKRSWVGWLVPVAGVATAVALYVATRPPAQPALESVESRVEVASEPTVPAEPQAGSSTSLARPSPEVQADRPPQVDIDAQAKATPASPIPDAGQRDRADVRQEGRVAELATPAERGASSVEAFRAEATAQGIAATEAAPPSAPQPASQAARNAAVQGRLTAATVEVRSPSGDHRWRTGNGVVEASTDAGATWRPATIAGAGTVRGGSSPAPGVCWLVGSGGAVWLTTDGLLFTRVQFPQALDLVAVASTTARSATVTAADGRTFRTSDAGATWSQ